MSQLSVHPAGLLVRTKRSALRVIPLVEALPGNRSADVLGRQLLRSGTSVGANYRAACRARSRREFIARMGIVEEEADESICRIDLLIEAGLLEQQVASGLLQEADELVALTVASIHTARRNGRP